METEKIRIRMESYDHGALDASAKEIVDLVRSGRPKELEGGTRARSDRQFRVDNGTPREEGPQRRDREMLEEILETVRGLKRSSVLRVWPEPPIDTFIERLRSLGGRLSMLLPGGDNLLLGSEDGIPDNY